MGRGSSKIGGGGESGGVIKTYDKIPLMAIMLPSSASSEDKAKKKAVIKDFMNDAAVGNEYKSGHGVGSVGASFEIVSYNRSPNKMGIRQGNWTVALNNANIVEFIKNGAALVKRGK